jgi:hypothetical protein
VLYNGHEGYDISAEDKSQGGLMGLLKTYGNGSSILPSDLDRLQEDYGASFSYLKLIKSASIRLDAPTTGTYLMVGGSSGSGILASAATAGLAVFYLDPEWFNVSPVNERTTYYQLAVSLLVNATAPATTFTPALYPITAAAGAAAAVSVTLGTAVGGSAVNFASPAAGSRGQAVSGFFPAPAAGYYTVGVAVASNAAANSSMAFGMALQMRQV